MRISKQIFCVAFAFACAALPRASAATITYLVTANTSSVLGQSGYLDLQLEPGPSPTNLATAGVTGFATDGALNGAATLTGDVTGQLPGEVSFDNQTVFNDYFQAGTFGTTESFDVTLSGPTPLGAGPSAFNIAFYASDGSTPLLTTSADGNAGQIVINADGTTTPITYSASVGVGSVLTINPVRTTNTAPEPSQLGLLGLALIGAFVIGGGRRLGRSV